jgi:hypothetical protein
VFGLGVAACESGTGNGADNHSNSLNDAIALTPCAGMPAAMLENRRSNDPVPVVARLVKAERLRDATYGHCITRITDHASEPPDGYARNDYSRRQAFNADGTRLLVASSNGYWYLYDAVSADYVSELSAVGGDAEPQWHPDDPRTLFYLPPNGRGMTIHSLNIETGMSQIVGDLSDRLRLHWPNASAASTRSEGSPSADARYWALLVEDAQGVVSGVFVWDRTADHIVSHLSIDGDPDYVSMSPSGNYVVIAWEDRTVVYTQALADPRVLLEGAEHSDLAIGADGDDYYVGIDFDTDEGDIFMSNLRTGERTRLLTTYINGSATSIHISGKGFSRPGWVVLSTFARTSSSPEWLHEKIMLVEMANNPRVFPLAHHQGIDVGYWTEPHASVNREMTRVVFNSNWGVASDTDVDLYRIELPEGTW